MTGSVLLSSKDKIALLRWPVVFGVLTAGATIAQSLLLAEVVARVLAGGAGAPLAMWRPLAGLIAAVVAGSACVWSPLTIIMGAASIATAIATKNPVLWYPSRLLLSRAIG